MPNTKPLVAVATLCEQILEEKDGVVSVIRVVDTYHVEPPWDAAILPELRKWFADFYTIEFENYPVDPDYLARPEPVAPAAAR